MKLKLIALAVCIAMPINFELKASDDFAVSPVAYADEAERVMVSGIVTDESGQPLVGAYVVEKNTTNGVMTDLDGRFSIYVTRDSQIEISFMSCISRSITIKGDSKLDIVLKEDRSLLEEVVVVGYGSQSRKSLTSSITTVKSDVIEGKPVTSAGESLKGRVAGLYAASNNSIPGQEPRFLIRGGSSVNLSNDPIVIVDGVNRSMSDLDPNDIESIEVLKDAASASIYGARASNGVILVTTKKGSPSKGPQITFDATVGFENAVDKWNFMNGTEFLQYLRPQLVDGYEGQAVLNGTSAAGIGNVSDQANYSPRYLNSGESVPDGWLSMADPIDPSKTIIYQEYDSQEKWFRTAPWQKYYVGVNGGSDKITYMASASYLNDGGVVRMTGYEHMSMHANTTFKVTDNLEASTTFDYARINQDQMYGSNWNVLGRGLLMGPTRKQYTSDGKITNGSGWFQDPDYWEKAYDFENIKNNFAGTFSLKWNILDGLSLYAQYGVYNTNTIHSMYQKVEVDGELNYRGKGDGTQEKRWSKIRDNFTAYMNYAKVFGDHDISLMAGYDFSRWRDWYLYAKSTGAVSDKVPTLSSGTVFTASNNDTQEALVSYYARANYGFKNKYLLGLTVRADGSSKFAAGHRWGWFPAVSAGWIVSEERLWDKVEDVANFFKLRASYGYTGNNGIGLYDAYGAYSTSSRYDGSTVTVASSMQNRDLTWERTSQLDLGFDINFLKDRIRLTADYYNKHTTDMLFNVTLPDTGSFNSVMANVGSARFYGYELALHTVNIDKKDFFWGTDITWSFNKNKVLSLDDSYKYKDLDGNDAWRIGGYTLTQTGERFGGIAVGESLGRIYGYKIDHIITSQEEADNAYYDALSKGYRREDGKRVAGRKAVGDYEWVNRPGSALTPTGEEMINAEDMFELGSVLPKYTGGINNTIKYKRLTLNVYCDFALGHSIVNYMKARVFMNTYGTCNGNIVRDVYDCWEPGKADYKYARFLPNDCDYGNSNFQRISDFCVEKGDFLCIRDVSISYDLPEKWLKGLKIQKLTVGISGNTLAYLDNVTGTISPEIGIGASSSGSWFSAVNTADNSNSNIAPAARKILFNVKLTF